MNVVCTNYKLLKYFSQPNLIEFRILRLEDQLQAVPQNCPAKALYLKLFLREFLRGSGLRASLVWSPL